MSRSKLKSTVLALSSVALICSAISKVYAAAPAVTPGPSTPVQVTNGTSNPVPVTGSLGVSGAVTIANPASLPLPVRNVDVAARQPFSRTLALNAQIGSLVGASTGQHLPYTVPPGKRLIIEDVGAQVLVPVGQKAQVVLEVQNPAPAGTFRTVRPLTIAFQLTSALGIPAQDVFVAGEPVRMAVNAGEILRAFFQRSAPTGSGVVEVYVHGYLVDVP
jgi:hypothetical protein